MACIPYFPIEADHRNFQALVGNRPRSLNIHAALCSSTQLLHFTNDKGKEVQGFVEFMSQSFLQKFHSKIYRNITRLEDLRSVQCIKVQRLLSEINVKTIDIWVLDTEGAELSVLQGTDFNAVSIRSIVMECDHTSSQKDAQKIQLLFDNGFTCQQIKRNCFCRHNSFVPSMAPPGAPRLYTGARYNITERGLGR